MRPLRGKTRTGRSLSNTYLPSKEVCFRRATRTGKQSTVSFGIPSARYEGAGIKDHAVVVTLSTSDLTKNVMLQLMRIKDDGLFGECLRCRVGSRGAEASDTGPWERKAAELAASRSSDTTSGSPTRH
jgi:hypothetical protein